MRRLSPSQGLALYYASLLVIVGIAACAAMALLAAATLGFLL